MPLVDGVWKVTRLEPCTCAPRRRKVADAISKPHVKTGNPKTRTAKRTALAPTKALAQLVTTMETPTKALGSAHHNDAQHDLSELVGVQIDDRSTRRVQKTLKEDFTNNPTEAFRNYPAWQDEVRLVVIIH